MAPLVGSGSPRGGATLVEVMVVFTILVVASGIFSRMVIAVSQLRDINRQNATAAEGARIVIESMRNEDFEEVYRLYNPDPTDDPDGAGTGPGNRFLVPGLEPLPGGDGLHAEVFLPGLPPGTPSQLIGTKWERVGYEVPTDGLWHVREDYLDAKLGMPRDLNGDSIIDSEPHSDDYLLLPVLVRVEWQGRTGPRSYEVHSMLAEFIVQ